MRKELPFAILVVVTLIVVAEFFFKIPAVTTAANEFKTWGIIIAAFALGLASINLGRVHLTRAAQKRKDWPFSVVLLVSMAVFALAGIALGPKATGYAFYYNNLLAPLTTAMQGMVIFFVASAAYRAFNIRSVEAFLLLFSTVIIMLGNVPIGGMISEQVPVLASWTMSIPNMAGQRGILITAAIGSIALGLRVILGIERSHFGGGA